MARYFRIEEAQQLLPVLEAKLRQALHLKSELVGAAAAVQAVSQRVAIIGGALVDRKQFLSLRGRQDALAKRLKETVAEIQRSGCQIKDLDVGLLDFPTLFRGAEVLLCWKLGEPEIRYWHAVDEGFRGRKEIDDDFLSNHRGDPPETGGKPA